MYRARAARAGPEPGSPGRFGILSTGQLRDLLQDEPKLDRIVRLSRKVARGARAGGAGDGPRPAGPADRPKGRAGRAAGPREPGTSEWAQRSRPRGRGRPEPAWGG